jgi:hypothetical protein
MNHVKTKQRNTAEAKASRREEAEVQLSSLSFPGTV